MRIGFFTDSYFPEVDGVTYTLKLWKERLEKRGHDVFIIYPDSSEYEPAKNEIPVKSISNPFYEGYNIPIPISSNKFPEDLDIVHCHSPATIGIAGRTHAYRNNISTVYTHHTPLEEYFIQAVKSNIIADSLGKLYVPFESRFLESFDRVTASTEKTNRNVETEKLAVGIDLDFFQPQEKSFVDELGLERPIIGYSGRISPEKNIDRIIDIADEVEGNFLIVGEGPQKKQLVEDAPENIKFMDFLDREKLPEFYSGIDLFITASTGDTLGLSPLEANACGTSVVAPNVYPFDETITSQNGKRFDLSKKSSMKQKIKEALNTDFDTREAVKRYSLTKTIDQLEELYTELE
jgi:1,2-diacylglycerol 3-alpha-glucosyltransferase